MLATCQRVAAIPAKRTAPGETHFLERDEIDVLFKRLPGEGRLARRDRALLLFLYNTGARVQEVADLRVGSLDLRDPATVRLHGKGDKWRTCPLWAQTAAMLAELVNDTAQSPADQAVFVSTTGQPLTRFGIYKIVRRHAGHLDQPRQNRTVSPHTFRHTAAVHLLEAGVEVNVIRGWLGHADLSTTNRFAEINTNAKIAALSEPPGSSAEPHRRPVWQTDENPAQLAHQPLSRCVPHRSSSTRCDQRSGDSTPHNPAGHRSPNLFRATHSGTRRAGTPPKNSNAATCVSAHDTAFRQNTGRTNMWRLHANTITNAHTRRRRSVAGSSHDPKNP